MERDSEVDTPRHELVHFLHENFLCNFYATLYSHFIFPFPVQTLLTSKLKSNFFKVKHSAAFTKWMRSNTSWPSLNYFYFVWIGGNNGLNGFGEFIYESVVPATFMAPMKSTFDMNDAQTILVCINKNTMYVSLFVNFCFALRLSRRWMGNCTDILVAVVQVQRDVVSSSLSSSVNQAMMVWTWVGPDVWHATEHILACVQRLTLRYTLHLRL